MLMKTFPWDELVFMQKPGGNGVILTICFHIGLDSHLSSPQSSLLLICPPLSISVRHLLNLFSSPPLGPLTLYLGVFFPLLPLPAPSSALFIHPCQGLLTLLLYLLLPLSVSLSHNLYPPLRRSLSPFLGFCPTHQVEVESALILLCSSGLAGSPWRPA